MEWFTKCRPVIKGANKYTIMIRHPDDPKRSPRPTTGGGRKDKTPHLTFRKMTEAQVARALLQLLGDGKPRTLNGMSVEIWDQNASVTGGTIVEDVLWKLCEDGSVAFTMKAPILFKCNVKNKRAVRQQEEMDEPIKVPKRLRIGGSAPR